ncbi:hypothetical protein V8E36_002504 [Tilletia maclaganii]
MPSQRDYRAISHLMLNYIYRRRDWRKAPKFEWSRSFFGPKNFRSLPRLYHTTIRVHVDIVSPHELLEAIATGAEGAKEVASRTGSVIEYLPSAVVSAMTAGIDPKILFNMFRSSMALLSARRRPKNSCRDITGTFDFALLPALVSRPQGTGGFRSGTAQRRLGQPARNV